jgi:hypothetical protein
MALSDWHGLRYLDETRDYSHERRLKVTATVVIAGVLVFAGAAVADDQEQRAKLRGSWVLQDASSSEAHAWTFDDKGDDIHLVHAVNGHTVADFECNTAGKECAVKESGHKAKVSMWYSGDKLVELETRGTDVMKRRFSVSGDTMEMEEIPVVPVGKSETLKFKRVQVSAGANH